jgi:predicted secreted Zn-dependent protease
MYKPYVCNWIARACLLLCLPACSPKNTQVVLTQLPTHEVLFPVWGETLHQVGAGVHGHLHGGFAGYSNWHLSYNTELHESLWGKCTVKKISLNFQSKLILPHWQSSGAFNANVQPTWDRFIAALRVHEQGHVQIALAQAQALVVALEAMSPLQGDHCDPLLKRVRQHFDQAIQAVVAASDRYDVMTKHGVTQGAKPEWFN